MISDQENRKGNLVDRVRKHIFPSRERIIGKDYGWKEENAKITRKELEKITGRKRKM